jgi:hypothetical protein
MPSPVPLKKVPKHGQWKWSLSHEDQCALEGDLEKGDYQKWVEKYPDAVYDIFGEYMQVGFDNPVTLQDIRYFQKHGVDLDEPSHAYHCDSYFSNALQMACEWRRLDWMEMLLEAKADVNLVTGDEFSPLDSAILGHGAYWIYNYQDIQDCITLLDKYGPVKREICERTAEILSEMLAPEAGPWLNEYFKDIPVRKEMIDQKAHSLT